MKFKMPEAAVKNPVMSILIVSMVILIIVFLIIPKENYKEVVDYRIDLPLREIESKQYIEHFKSYPGLDEPQGITNTDIMGRFFKPTKLAGDWDNFIVLRPILKSSPVPEYLPQNIVTIENDFIDASNTREKVDRSLGDRSRREKGYEMDSAINKYTL